MIKQKLVVWTGGGISAESGIRPFRDSDGLWEKYPVEDVATPEGFERNPELVLNFYNGLREKSHIAKPNYGHVGLKELEKYFDVEIITQNVDDLHEQAGSKNIIHLHGELMKVRSVKDPNLVYKLSPDNYIVKLGDKGEDGAQLGPHIVWFGEPVPNIEPAIKWVEKADIFLVIGTSLNVYPAAGLINYVRPNVPIYLIDPKPGAVPGNRNVTIIQKGASEGMKEFMKDILIEK